MMKISLKRFKVLTIRDILHLHFLWSSDQKLSSIDCVNIYLFLIFFSIDCVNSYLFSIFFQWILPGGKVWGYPSVLTS